MDLNELNNRRMDRQTYYLRIAEVVAERGTCPKAKVGAVLVDPDSNRIISMGYNGSAKGAPHCNELGCLEIDLGTGHGKSCIRTIHAELNALLHLDKRYGQMDLYSTHQPCFQCFKALVAAGVVNMFYLNPYQDRARDLLHGELPWITMHQVSLQEYTP